MEGRELKRFTRDHIIDLTNDQDIDRCCERLDCCREQLMYCIRCVGNSFYAVELFWSMNEGRIKLMIKCD